jgi:Putative MetA-pathway of phenol degradation
MEFFSEVSTQRNTPWVGTFDVGLTYAVTENIQLDAGINIGVTESAPDFNPFLGLSWRF